MRQTTMKRTIGMLTVGLAFTVAACGSDADSSASTTTAPEGTTSTAPDSTTIADDATTTTSEAPSGDEVTVTEADSASTVAVAAGDTVRVELQNCATCGYEWRERSAPEGAVLELLGKELIEPDRTDGMVGGYETAVYTYRATGAGSAAIDLGYVGPGGSREGEFTLTVTVS